MDVTASELREVLERAQQRGLIGRAPLEESIVHARGFASGVRIAPRRFADLGSGGGLPGLVLALEWPSSEVILIEGSSRRAAVLEEAVDVLGIRGRVRVVGERAELAGRRPELRGTCDLVVARGFGPPAVTAECAAPLLRPGGRLIVSEPPTDDPGGPSGRWPAEGLRIVGFTVGEAWSTPFHYRSLVLDRLCPERFPRRVGIPGKRPLF